MFFKLENLKISHKLALLVSVPLIFSCLFLGVFSIMLQQSDAEAKREAHAKNVMLCVERIAEFSMEATAAIPVYVMTRSESFRKQFEKCMNESEKQFRQLDLLLKDDREQSDKLIQWRDTMMRGFKLMAAIEQSLDDDVTNMGLLEIKGITRQLQSLILQETKIRKEFIDELQSQLSRSESNVDALKGAIWALILAVFVFNIGLSFGLVWFITHGVVNRVEALVSNSARVAAGQQLLPLLEGRDEIAKLDHEFHSMAKQLDEAKEREKEVDRLKQEFIAMVSHDLRTPISSVLLITQMLQEGLLGQLNERGRFRVASSEGELMRLLDLVNGLLDLERFDLNNVTLSKEAVDLNVVIERSISSVLSVAEKANVTIQFEKKEADAFADSSGLVQVLVNLLSNAVKFSPSGGKIVVSTEELEDAIEVRVTDEGRGIPADKIDIIFERFKQVEASDRTERKGAGLGLSICKSIVEAHGGAIGVMSEEGKGSTFWFRIPLD